MKHCRPILRHLLTYRFGFNITSRLSKELTILLAKEPILQHQVNALELEIFQSLEKIEFGKKKRLPINAELRNQLKSVLLSKEDLPVLNIEIRMPNVMAGKAFNEPIILPIDLVGEVEFHYVDGITVLPDVKIDKGFVLGCINTPGEYELTLKGLLKLTNGQLQKLIVKLSITVIADPRLLWKNIACDPSARFHKLDSKTEAFTNDSVIMIGASVRGRSHAHKGIHRDDDFKLICSPANEWNILCVADGAGSCKYSRRGAEVAALRSARVLRETLGGHFGEDIELAFDAYESDKSDSNRLNLQEIYQHTIVKAVHQAAMAINEEVDASQGDKFKDFSTTLLLAAHKPVVDGHLVLAFWIGDGGAVIYQEGEAVHLLGEPDCGEFAGQTRFLDNKIFQDGSIYNRIVMHKVPSMTALLLATDGITDAKFETEKQLANVAAWDVVWEEIKPYVTNTDLEQGKIALTKWMDFWSPGNHDDRSIAVCWVKE